MSSMVSVSTSPIENGLMLPPSVRSRHMMEWIDVEPVWLLCPELANVFEGREAFQGLEALGEVIGVEKGFQVYP